MIRFRFGLMLVMLLFCSTLEAREWVDSTGKYKVEAEFVEVVEGQVSLRGKDGTTFEIPLEKLSRADRSHVAELLKMGDKPASAAATGESGKAAVAKDTPFVLSDPAFVMNENGSSFGVVAHVKATNGQGIAEQKLWPAWILFEGPVDGELTDLAPVPSSIDTHGITVKDPVNAFLNVSWNFASKQADLRGKAEGMVANYQPGSPETILFVQAEDSSLQGDFGQLPSAGGQWGLVLCNAKLQCVSNVLLFSKEDLESVKHPAKVWGDRMKQLAAEEQKP
jgi:hypothetical protein